MAPVRRQSIRNYFTRAAASGVSASGSGTPVSKTPINKENTFITPAKAVKTITNPALSSVATPGAQMRRASVFQTPALARKILLAGTPKANSCENLLQNIIEAPAETGVGLPPVGSDDPILNGAIKVFIRIRPFSDSEVEAGAVPYISIENNEENLILETKPSPIAFTFDRVLDGTRAQADIFHLTAAPIADDCLVGYNGSIFAYGQTGSGKTFTMQGPHNVDCDDAFEADLRGIIPRTIEFLHARVLQAKTNVATKDAAAVSDHDRSIAASHFNFRCSYLEIYNEQIIDLLCPSSKNLSIRDDTKKGSYIPNLEEKTFESPDQALEYLEIGSKNRKTGCTSMNSESSRSHSVFTIIVQNQCPSRPWTSRLHLVDLAGSERQKSAKTEGVALKEAASINKSLSALGNVIRSLCDVAAGKNRHIHYRDSKLTFFLKDALGGNSKTCIISNISPAEMCFGETLSTLKFAQRAKTIKNKISAIDLHNGTTTFSEEDAQLEISRLKQELAISRMTLVSSSPNKKINGALSHPVNFSELREILLNRTPKSIHDDENSAAKIHDLEVMLCSAIDFIHQLQDQQMKTNRVFEAKENYINQLVKMLRVKEDRISTLLKKNSEYNASDREEQLQSEINILRQVNENHPDVAMYATENAKLKEEICRVGGVAAAAWSSVDAALKSSITSLMKEKHVLMTKLSLLSNQPRLNEAYGGCGNDKGNENENNQEYIGDALPPTRGGDEDTEHSIKKKRIFEESLAAASVGDFFGDDDLNDCGDGKPERGRADKESKRRCSSLGNLSDIFLDDEENLLEDNLLQTVAKSQEESQSRRRSKRKSSMMTPFLMMKNELNADGLSLKKSRSSLSHLKGNVDGDGMTPMKILDANGVTMEFSSPLDCRRQASDVASSGDGDVVADWLQQLDDEDVEL